MDLYEALMALNEAPRNDRALNDRHYLDDDTAYTRISKKSSRIYVKRKNRPNGRFSDDQNDALTVVVPAIIAACPTIGSVFVANITA